MKWHTRTYADPATGEVVSRYVSLDGKKWMPAYSTEEVDAREQARRSVVWDRSVGPKAPSHSVKGEGSS